MTCAACANRIERKLNKMDGISATVNYATEKAHIQSADGSSAALPDAQEFIDLVDSMGYGAQVDRPASAAEDAETEDDGAPDQELHTLRQRVVISAWLAVPVIALAMVPALQFKHWQWLSLTLAAPVIVWGGWPFHRATWKNLKQSAFTMDSLITIGTLSALRGRCMRCFSEAQGCPECATRGCCSSQMRAVRTVLGGDIYLEVGAGVILFVLAGRYFEKRAKHRAGSALRALTQLGAREATVCEWESAGAGAGSVVPRSERTLPIDQLQVGQFFVVRPGEKVATDGVVVEGHSAIDASMLTGESVPVEIHAGIA